MKYDSHVYLGPTLHLQEAKNYLPQAYYHPPIKCGDLIRLFRLKPKRIIIIDGVFERTLAVWHKEIMLGLDNGIEIYGAASMGALRAAELYPFGMIGIGQVFQDFYNKKLNDDDEVAVLHQNQDGHFTAINDAMVNIRATLELAFQHNIISITTKDYLIDDCKRQFYPHRSLKKSILQFEKQNPRDGKSLSKWLLKYGLVDIKKHDAQLVLTHVQASILSESTIERRSVDNLSMPVTKFIATLVDEAALEPFDFQAKWLPEQEQKLQALSQENTTDFQLVTRLTTLLKIFDSIEAAPLPLDITMLLNYIHTHGLYSPENDFSGIASHSTNSRLYVHICKLICQGHISISTVTGHIPAATFYFQLEDQPLSSKHQQLLRIIILLICAAHTHLEDHRLKIKPKVLANHLRDLRLWPRLTRYNEANPTRMINEYKLIEFIALYMQVTYVYQGTRDTIQGSPNTPKEFNWLHDAFEFYHLSLNTSMI